MGEEGVEELGDDEGGVEEDGEGEGKSGFMGRSMCPPF